MFTLTGESIRQVTHWNGVYMQLATKGLIGLSLLTHACIFSHTNFPHLITVVSSIIFCVLVTRIITFLVNSYMRIIYVVLQFKIWCKIWNIQNLGVLLA